MGADHGNLKIGLEDCGIEYFFFNNIMIVFMWFGWCVAPDSRFWEMLVSGTFCLLVQRC